MILGELKEECSPSQDELKERIAAHIDGRFLALEQSCTAMLNCFHIDIIRQFEIQKTQLTSLVEDYMLKDEAEDDQVDEQFIIHRSINRPQNDDDDDLDMYLENTGE